MRSRLLLWSYSVCMVLLSASTEIAKGDCKDFDFENGSGTLSKWEKTGNAFDNQPTYGDNARIRDPRINTNVQGDWWIGTFENRSKPGQDGGYMTGDYPLGTLTSPKFRITGPKMSFRLGGGCDAGQLKVELLVNGQVTREAFADECRERMRKREWDVRQFKNQIAQIRLIDASRKGHINFDDLWGDFTCIGNETDNVDLQNSSSLEKHKVDNEGDKDNFVIVDEPLAAVNPNVTKSRESLLTGTGNKDEFFIVGEPLLFVNRNESDSKSHEIPMTKTDDEYDAFQNSSRHHASMQHTPIQTGNNISPHFLQGTKISDSNIITAPKRPLLQNAASVSTTNNSFSTDDDFRNPPNEESHGIQNASKLHGPVHHTPAETPKEQGNLGETQISDSNLNTRPRQPLFPKVFSLTKIAKASLNRLRDNSSNQSLPNDDELRNLSCKSFLVKIKTGKPWDNDFLFTSNGNYQSTRREIEVKVLEAYEEDKDFRGAFFTKFSSYDEPGEVKAFFVLRFRAVGKFLGRLIDKLGAGNVSAAGCFDTSTQCPSPCSQTCAPLCQSSCCQQYVSSPVAPVTQCPSPCPQTCAPSCQSSCCQQHVSAPVAQPVNPVAPVAQCPSPCPKACAPLCQPSCCQRPASSAVAPLAAAVTPVGQCPSPCPQACSPSCQPSCCQQHVSTPIPPQVVPFAQCPRPCPQACAPSCQPSCCQRPSPPPVAPVPSFSQCPNPCPQTCAPSCETSCCQRYASPPALPQPVFPPLQPLQITVSTPQLTYMQPPQQWNPPPQVYATRPPVTQGLSGSQCSEGCSPNCAPICSQACCQFYDASRRKGEVKKWLRRESLQEEKH